MGSGESHTPAATARATTSVVRTALGDAFDELHPKVQWRFGLSASDERCQVGVGVMEEMTHSALIPPPMLWLGARRGLFPGGKARDVPFTIVNYAYVDELGRDTLSFVRRFSFAGSPQGMNSVMVTPTVSTSPGHALDYLGFHSDMIVRTTCSVDDDGGLVLESGAPKVLGVPTPHLASATTIGREWWDEHEERHRIQIEVTSPVMGRLFLYRGWFTAEERPCPAGDIPASAKPTRLERRE